MKLSDSYDSQPVATPKHTDGDAPKVPTARPVAMDVLATRQEPRSPIFLDDISRRDAWIDIGLMILLVVGLSIAAELVATTVFEVLVGLSSDDPAWEQHDFTRYLRVPILAIRVGVTLTIIIFLLKTRRQPATSVGLTARAPLLDSLIGVVSMGVAFGFILVWQVAIWILWPDALRQMQQNAGRIMNLIPKMHPLTLGALSLAVGLYEELIFRGFLMTRLRRATGSWMLAVLLSTAVFTLPHAVDQEWIALVPVGILSLCMSLVTIWRRSIIPAIIGHFLFDWVQFMYLYVMAGDQWT